MSKNEGNDVDPDEIKFSKECAILHKELFKFTSNSLVRPAHYVCFSWYDIIAADYFYG